MNNKLLIKIMFLFNIVTIVLFAKQVPIQKVVSITLPIGVPSIIEFPFEIKAVKATSFIYKVKIKKDNSLDLLEPLSANNKNRQQNAKQNKVRQKDTFVNKPIIISRTKRVITITPKKEGRMSLIIWGYKYPIILDIKTKLMKKDSYDRYIEFIDYSQNKQKAFKFEAVPHEKVIIKLIRYIYNNKVPQGYTYQVGTLDYTTNGIRLIQVKSIIGNRYKAEEWIVENETNRSIILYPQMFYTNGIYAVTFENNKLRPKEKVRMFIVAKNK